MTGFIQVWKTVATGRLPFIEGFSIKNHSMIAQRRIYCLTPDPGSTLMWSHYGDNHRGICLEFDLDNPAFLNSWEVKYSSTYPNWVPHKARDVAMDLILTKSDQWAYEQEFRIIASPDYEDGHPLKPVDDFIKLPIRSLMSVIVGCKGEYDQVRSILLRHMPSLALKRMIRVKDHYRLVVGD